MRGITRALAVSAAAAALWAASCPAAGESISFNGYRDAGGKITIDGAGVLKIPASAWNNVTADGVPSEVKLLSSDKTTTSTITLETSAHINGIWYLASTWTSAKDSVTKTTGNGQLFFNYMDSYSSGSGGNGWVSLSNIPFTEYTLYIYPGSEGDAKDTYGTMSAFQVTAGGSTQLIKGNGTSATEKANSLTESWGTNQSFREENNVAPVLTEGVNYLKLTGLSGNLKIEYPEWSGSRRAGMAGFQIVNTGSSATNYTATASNAAVTFSDVSWSDGTSEGQSLTGGALNTATLTLEPGSTLTFTEAVPTLYKLKLVSTGKVTLAVSGEGVTLDTALANVANFDFTGVTELDIGALTKSALTVPEGATLTMNAPRQVTTLTQNGKVKYAGGEALPLFDIQTAAQNNKTTIIDKTISSVKTSSPEIRDLAGYFAINGTRTIELGENADITVTERFAMADDGAADPVLNQNGGTITVTSDGTTNTSTTGTAVILGHWDGTPAYNLKKGTLSVANGAIMLGWSGNPTMTIGTSDGVAQSAKVITKGIVSHGAWDQGPSSTLVLNPSGVIEVGSLGLNFSNTCKTGSVVELAGGLLKVTDNAPLALANQSGLKLSADTTISVNSEKTLTVSTPFTGTGALTLTGGGTVDLSALGKNLPKIASIEAGTTLRVAPISQSERLTGSFSASLPLAEGATLSGTIEYQDGNTWKAATVTPDGTTATLSGTFSTDATLTGSSWWWDYEFNDNSNASSGSDTGAVTLESSETSSYTDADSTGNQALYFQQTPYRGATYPAELTAVMRCQPGNYANTALICFGSTATDAATPDVAIALTTGATPANGDMRLVLIIGEEGDGYTVTDLVEGGLNVANATTAQHLYAFSIATVDGKTQIAVYVDGKRKTLYTHPTAIALSGGFQIGSLHGGVFSTGLSKYPNSGNSGTVDFLRVSKEVLTDAAMKAMADKYPYVSTKGLASRTVSEETATWEGETNPWSQAMPNAEATAQAAPNAGTNVALTASADTTITLNGTTAVTYESMTFEGTGAVTLSATATSATMLASDLTVSTNLTVPAHLFTAGTVSVDEGKTLTFDCSGLDGLKTTYVLTGYVEPDVADRILVANTEIAGSPFTYEKAQNSAGSVILRATSVKPLTATVSANCAWADITWTWEGNTTPTALGNLTSASDITLTLGNGAEISPASALAISGTLTMSGTGLLDLPTGSTVATTAIGDGTTLQLHQAQAAVVTTRSGLAGTFKFVGGTNDKPLLIQTNDFPGAIAVAANSYIKIAHSGGNVKYVVSGEGKTSTVWISGSKGWGTDPDGTKFTNVKLAITGGNTFWMRAGSTEDVWLDITQGNSVSLENNAVNGSAVTDRLIVRALTGGGTIQKGSGVTGERYVCLHNPNEAAATYTRSGTFTNVGLMFTGAWNITEQLGGSHPAITVGDGTIASTLTLSGQNGGYTGKTITIAENATLVSSGDGDINVPFGKGTNAKIVNNGTLRVAASNGQIPPVSGKGNVVIAANCRLAGALTTTGTLTVPSGCTLDLSKDPADTFDGTPSIYGPSVECKGEITNGTVTIASTRTLSGTGTIGSALTFANGAKLDVTNGALTATGTVTIADDATVTVTGATASTTTILTCSNPATVAAKLTGAPEGYTFAANEAGTAVVLAAVPTIEIPEVDEVPLSADSQAVLQAVAQEQGLAEVTAVSGSTTVNGTETRLTAAQIDNVLAVFGDSVVTADGTTLKVDYNFGIVAITPSYNPATGEVTMFTVTVEVKTVGGNAATLADGASIELVDNTGVPLRAAAPFVANGAGGYDGYFYATSNTDDHDGLIGKTFKVKATK